MNLPPVRHVAWKPCWRIIPTRYPEERLFDRVTEPRDRDIMEELDQMTSDRIRQERGEVDLVPPGDRVTGPGSTYIMAAFSYRSPGGSRFTDGNFGVYYTTRTLETAVAESCFHRERFMRWTKENPMRLEMRVLTANLSADLHDVRGMGKQFPKIYNKTSYIASQELAIKLRRSGAYGIAYDSVRHDGGECAALFRPTALGHCRQERHLIYEWDGKQIVRVFELREYLKEEKE